MALAVATIVDAISKISVAGVVIKDINEMPNALDGRERVLFPSPDQFIGGFKVTQRSFGVDTARKLDVEYDLNYILCVEPVGSGRGLFDIFPDLVSYSYAIVDACLADNTITGAVRFDIMDVYDFGLVSDPQGNEFWGCKIKFHVMEFVD